MDVYFKINHRNRLIYILTHIKFKNNKYYLTLGIGLPLFLWYLTQLFWWSKLFFDL